MDDAPPQQISRSLLARLALFLGRTVVGIVFWLCLPFAVVFVFLTFFTAGPGVGNPVPIAATWKWLIPAGVCGLLAAGAGFVWRKLPSGGRGWLVPLLERGMNSPVTIIVAAVVVPFYTLCVFAFAYRHPYSYRWYVVLWWAYGSYLALKGAWTLWRERCGRL